MIFLHALVNSLKLPNKKAIFRLNRIGMDITVVYMFILLFLASLPSLADQLTATGGLGDDMNVVFKLIYFFIFYYLPLIVIFFILLSAVAYLGTLAAKMLERKLKFSILWKMSAYTTTIPLLLYTGLSFFLQLADLYLLAATIFTAGLLVRIITVYPRRNVRKRP
ncbi:hypothetical protein [Virgibacillus sediminis]|uniref:DUF1189 domain-containing protein n=1 Tax=Virgibacillus sediminis TaxID=202260 RepID=A0ABV7A753_9BACI